MPSKPNFWARLHQASKLCPWWPKRSSAAGTAGVLAPNPEIVAAFWLVVSSPSPRFGWKSFIETKILGQSRVLCSFTSFKKLVQKTDPKVMLFAAKPSPGSKVKCCASSKQCTMGSDTLAVAPTWRRKRQG